MDYISTSHMSEQRTDSHIYTRMTTESSKAVCQNRQVALGLICGDKVRSDNDDYIAFPYGVREGEKTKVSEDGMY